MASIKITDCSNVYGNSTQDPPLPLQNEESRSLLPMLPKIYDDKIGGLKKILDLIF
jgi:hypothetical protein